MNFDTKPMVSGTPARERSIRANETDRNGRRSPNPRQSLMNGPTPRLATAATTRNAPAFMNTWANIWKVAPVIAGEVPIAMPISMYPAWEIDEYASIRFISLCISASTFPTVIVRMARMPRVSCSVAETLTENGPSEPVEAVRKKTIGPMKTRKKAKRPIFFEPPARNAETSVGAPS